MWCRKKILLVNHHLVNYAGSEIVTFEIALYFKKIGWDVWVATFFKGLPMLQNFLENDIKVFDVLNGSIPEKEYDLVWAHHFPCIIKLFLEDGIKTKNFIYSSLSNFEPLETIIPDIAKIADLVLVNSKENFDTLLTYSDVDRTKVRIFPNSVPTYFFSFYSDKKDRKLKNIAIVSNHPPEEILGLIQKLNEANFNVDLYGIRGKFKLITPEILSCYDAVITIGKTVQYCMAVGVPVFCYDHFGGPGWINKENYIKAEAFNYSGRCTPVKRSVEELFEEFLSGYDEAFQDREFFYYYAYENYNLEKNVENVLDLLSKRNTFIIMQDKNLWLKKINEAYIRELSGKTELQARLSQVEDELVRVRGELEAERNEKAELQTKLTQVEDELVRVYLSKSWRITRPLRWLRRKLRI